MNEFDNPDREKLMVEGLKRICDFIHEILRKEIEMIGRENVVIWGLSMERATSLMSLLTWDDEAFAAVIGTCGYFPFANHVKTVFER